jgi:hypothetical protein
METHAHAVKEHLDTGSSAEKNGCPGGDNLQTAFSFFYLSFVLVVVTKETNKTKKRTSNARIEIKRGFR